MAKILVEQYAASLEFDLAFQGFENEIDRLPEEYGSPSGCFLLGEEHDRFIGCVAVRKITKHICEMKRLYVSPEQRGGGAGRVLATAIVEEGRQLGYKRMRLDTVPAMKAAQALYTSLGFREIPPYCHNPVAGATFLELVL